MDIGQFFYWNIFSSMTDFVTPDGVRVHLIGDPHMGKRFDVGVPLHRRGERETKQAVRFQQELTSDADVIVVVGDLFDHPYVPYATVDGVAKAIREAAISNPEIDYIIMAGNHDVPRNITAIGAFHDLEDRLRDRAENLHISRRPFWLRGLAIFPWEWDRTAHSQISDITKPAHAAIGHWDMVSYEGKDQHLAPVAELCRIFGPNIKLYSGHYHKAGDYVVEGATIHGTGSMEPYSHGEDPAGDLYVTLSRAEVLAMDAKSLRNKNVRVQLAVGEDMPVIDALSAIPFRLPKDIKQKNDTLSLSDFDWNTILSRRIKPLDPTVKAFIKERLPYDDSNE